MRWPRCRVPEVPLGYVVAGHDEALRDFLDPWIELERLDRKTDALYEHWMLGRAANPRERRWSVIRNVLGWID